MPIFDGKQRISSGIKSSSESDYEFLDRSSWESMRRVREHIEHCWRRYPESEKNELKARLISREGFDSAAFELLLHEMLLTMGCALEPHPDIGASTRPDFLVTTPSGDEFIVEAVLASEINSQNASAEAIKNQVIDMLQQYSHPDFYINISASGSPNEAPSAKKFAEQVVKWLSKFNYDELRAKFEASNFAEMPVEKWDLKGWKVELQPMPAAPDRRGQHSGLIGIAPTTGGVVNSWQPLRDAITKKNGKYGELQRPMIIAVNFKRFYLNELDEIQALYGQEKIVINREKPEKVANIIHENNGAWAGPDGPQCTRTSGVWFFKNLNPYSAARAAQRLYLNPWSKYIVPDFMRTFPTVEILKDGKIVKAEGLAVGSLLGLPKEWPEN